MTNNTIPQLPIGAANILLEDILKQKEGKMKINNIINEAKDLGYTLSRYETRGEEYCLRFKHPKLQSLLEAVVLFTRGEFHVFLSIPCKAGFLPVSVVRKIDQSSIATDLKDLRDRAWRLLGLIKEVFFVRQNERDQEEEEEEGLLRGLLNETLKLLNKIDEAGYAKVVRLKAATNPKDTIYRNLKCVYQNLVKGGAIVHCSKSTNLEDKIEAVLFARGKEQVKASLLPINDYYEQLALGDKLYLKFLRAARIERHQRSLGL
jgi:hypothetical protein